MTKILMAASVALSLSTTFSAHAEDDSNIKWPDADHAWLKKGTFVDVEQLRRIGAGMSKDQVRELISYPHFSEGFFHPRKWNYVFNFRTGNGNEYVTCQYQIHFDKHENLESTYWRDPACADYVKAKPVVNQTHPITVNADGLFAFGKSGLNDLQQSGRDNLSSLSRQIKDGYKNLRSVEITGYTDRIGSNSGNMALSLARANTVKQYLVTQGIPAGKITAQGAGSSNPKVFCNGPKSPSVVTCLMPNRRIEISVNGDL